VQAYEAFYPVVTQHSPRVSFFGAEAMFVQIITTGPPEMPMFHEFDIGMMIGRMVADVAHIDTWTEFDGIPMPAGSKTQIGFF
jgi:hypothetical protein